MSEKPPLVFFTFLGFYLTAALDAGRGQEFSFQQVYEGLERGTLLDDLDRALPDVFDFSIYRADPDQREGFMSILREVAGGLEGRERRKLGVQDSGIALLLAFVLEAIQSRTWG